MGQHSQNNETVEMSVVELELTKQMASMKTEVEALKMNYERSAQNLTNSMAQVAAQIESLRDAVSKWPEQMSSHKDGIFISFNRRLEDFMTHKDGELMEQKLESKIDTMQTKFRTMVMTVVGVGTLIGFILNLVVITYQLNRFLGGE